MFWDKKEESASVSVVEPEVRKEMIEPKSQILTAELGFDEFEEYQKVASELGISNGAVLGEKITHVLKDECISVYDNLQVTEYLNEKLGEWCWAGLRPKDVDRRKGWHATYGQHQIQFTDTQYMSAIPLPVLLTVKKITDRISDVFFYVSEKKNDPHADPFLMVSGNGTRSFIIEKWDEPDFRER